MSPVKTIYSYDINSYDNQYKSTGESINKYFMYLTIGFKNSLV